MILCIASAGDKESIINLKIPRGTQCPHHPPPPRFAVAADGQMLDVANNDPSVPWWGEGLTEGMLR